LEIIGRAKKGNKMPSFQTTVNMDVEVDVDFEVFCARCGAGLCNQSDTRASRNRKYPQVTVEPCERCLENASEEARQKAMEEAEQLTTAVA
jgi:hypothetical protein